MYKYSLLSQIILSSETEKAA